MSEIEQFAMRVREAYYTWIEPDRFVDWGKLGDDDRAYWIQKAEACVDAIQWGSFALAPKESDTVSEHLPDLHASILGAMARTRVEREKPAAVLRAINEAGYVVIKLDREVMARAIWESGPVPYRGYLTPWEGIRESTREQVRKHADGVLAMLDAGDLDPIDPATVG